MRAQLGRAFAQVRELAQQGVRSRRCRQLIVGRIGHGHRADVNLDGQVRAEDAVDVVQPRQDLIARVLLAAVARAEARIAERRQFEPSRRAGRLHRHRRTLQLARERRVRIARLGRRALGGARGRTRIHLHVGEAEDDRLRLVGRRLVQRVAHFGGRLDRVELGAVPHHSVQCVALGRKPHPGSGDAVDRAAIQLELRLLGFARHEASVRAERNLEAPTECVEAQLPRGVAGFVLCSAGRSRAGPAAARNRRCEPGARRRSRPPRAARAPCSRRPTDRRAPRRRRPCEPACFLPRKRCAFLSQAPPLHKEADHPSATFAKQFRECRISFRCRNSLQCSPAGLAYI